MRIKKEPTPEARARRAATIAAWKLRNEDKCRRYSRAYHARTKAARASEVGKGAVCSPSRVSAAGPSTTRKRPQIIRSRPLVTSRRLNDAERRLQAATAFGGGYRLGRILLGTWGAAGGPPAPK